MNYRMIYDAGIQEKLKNFRDNAKNPDVLRTAITQDDLVGISHIVAKKSETQSENTSTTSTPSLSPLSSSSQKRYDLPRSDTDSFKSFSDNEGISIKSEEKVPINCKSDVQSMTGELTLAFSGTSHDSNSYPSQQRSFVNLRESGSCSMPSSPNDKDRELDSIGRTARPSSGSPQSLCSPLYSSINNHCGSFIYPPTCASVRISKSEDYLQHHKDNMSSVNIELDEDITSSLNTLLDTRDDLPVCSSFTSLNSCAISNHANNDEVDLSTVWTVNALHSSSPESCGHSSHDSDSPLIHSPSPVSPHSPTSSMQYSCSGGIYDKIYSGCDSVGSSNRSANVCSNSSSLTSPDTDVPDELEWDDTTPTLSPTNQLVNGFSEKSRITNGHSANLSASTDSSISDKISKRLDENRIIIKVAGPGKNSLIVSHSQKNNYKVQRENGTINCDPDKTPTNTPPQTPGSGTLSPETLAYQQLWDSEDEITCLSEKSDDSRNAHKKSASHRTPCASSPPLSEDESDIESLHSFHYSPKAVDMPSVVRLAKRLYLLEGFKKSDVSRHLSKK